MCSHLFGKSSGTTEGIIGDVVGGLAGGYYGGPIGAALGAEAGGTLGGVAGGESVGTAATNALPAAGIAGIGMYGAEAFGGATAAGGTDLFGVSGTPSAAPATVAPAPYSGVAPDSSVIGASDAGVPTAGADGYIDPSTGLPVPPTPPSATAAIPGATATGAAPPANPYTVGGALKADTAGTASPDAGGGGTLAKIADTLGISKSNILPAGVAGIGLAHSLMAPSTLQGQPQLNAQATQLAQQSEMMQSYLQTGQLPPGVKTAIDNATAGAKAAIKAKYAHMGIPGSSAEAQELQQVDLNAAAQGADLAIKLYTEGTQDATISAQIYQSLLSTDVQQQKATSDAIANMAAALSGQGGAYQKSVAQPVAH